MTVASPAWAFIRGRRWSPTSVTSRLRRTRQWRSVGKWRGVSAESEEIYVAATAAADRRQDSERLVEESSDIQTEFGKRGEPFA